jgi:thiol:disulfide interchange protein
MRPLLAPLFGALLALLSAGTATAEPGDRAATEQVAAQLVAAVDAVYPGEEILLGVHQRIIPHWHTYWKNPGDSGIATVIDWTLPQGASAGDILWPTPGRHSLGPVTNYGYEHEITLPSKVKIPTDAKPGSTFTADAAVEWLVCREECLPQQVQLRLSLPVKSAGAPRKQGHPWIDAALQQQPQANPWPVAGSVAQDGPTLRVALNKEEAQQLQEAWFYPDQWGWIAQSARQTARYQNGALVLPLQKGDAPAKAGEHLSGVLVLKTKTDQGEQSRGYLVQTRLAAAGSPVSAAANSEAAADIGLVSALALALLGGVILNLMPCVFPVLSIKAISLVNHAAHAPRETRLHGLAYTAGVLASFALLAGLLILLKAGGAKIGWGFQFQSPVFVLAVAYLMFAVGLNLSGLFTIGGAITGVGASLADKSGYSGSFFTGVLATIVATPCTAPFMAAALGYALAQPPLPLLAIFLSLGLGLALPYLLLTWWPRLQRLLPRPGVWMERAKQLFAFPMYGAAAWLVWVLAQQAGPTAVGAALAGMVALALAGWLYGITRHQSPLLHHGGSAAALVLIVSALAGGYAGAQLSGDAPDQADVHSPAEKHWEAYSPERLQALREQGKPVFMNFTAAWCISCLVNERVALSDNSVVSAFQQSGITYLKGDWTNRDARITEILAKFGRSGVPLYVYYPAGADSAPVELPQILTPGIVLDAIRQATQSLTHPS